MLDDLLDEAIDRAREAVETRMDDRIRDDDLTEEDVERIAHEVGIGAVRYDIVSKQPAKAITFEWEDALDFEGQSAPFVQYVHARCCGILDEAADAGIEVPGVTADSEGVVDVGALDVDATVFETDAARDLLREVARFPAAIESAADDLEPHTIATFTREFADAYNAFYRECPVVTSDDEELRPPASPSSRRPRSTRWRTRSTCSGSKRPSRCRNGTIGWVVRVSSIGMLLATLR